MSNHFGSYAIISNVKHHFEHEPEWYWEIKPPTVTEDLIMANFMYGGPVTEMRDGLRHDDGVPTALGIAMKEVSLLFAGTSIPADPKKPVKDGGEPILKADDPPSRIEQVVKTMPTPMLMEIWKKIGESMPTLSWGPAQSKENAEEAGTDPK